MNKNIIDSELKYYGHQPEFQDNYVPVTQKTDSPNPNLDPVSYEQFKEHRDGIIGALVVGSIVSY